MESNNNAAANAVAAVADAISIDPEVIGQMKGESDQSIRSHIEDVLQQHHRQQQQQQEEQAENQNQESSKNQRILPRTAKNQTNSRSFNMEAEIALNISGMNVQNIVPNMENGNRLQIGGENGDQFVGRLISSDCTRCKKSFATPESDPKHYKLCPHCRGLQRERSRRWQTKTKKKDGACRRCGQAIAPEDSGFVLCPSCRKALRTRKANRAAQGKCVHCSGPNDSLNGDFKVCQRCRNNDKIRRNKLEKQGACNRCAKPLLPDDINSYKVCSRCRNRKKKPNTYNGNNNNNVNSVDPKMQAQVAAAAAASMGINLNQLPPEVQQQLQQQLQLQQRQQEEQQQHHQQQQHDQQQQDQEVQYQQISNDNQHFLAEDLVQQLQSAAAASSFASAALVSRDKKDDGKENDSGNVDEQNNLFLNPEAEEGKPKKEQLH